MFAIAVRAVMGTRQFGHSWSAAAHEAQARKWLHGPKRTVRGASASMQIVQRRRSSSASFSRLISTSAPVVASVAGARGTSRLFFGLRNRTSCDLCALAGPGTTLKTSVKAQQIRTVRSSSL